MAMPTASERRKARIQAYPKSAVEMAIKETVYGEAEQRAVRDVFVGNATYDEAAYGMNMSPSGFYKKMRRIMPPVENYLKRLN